MFPRIETVGLAACTVQLVQLDVLSVKPHPLLLQIRLRLVLKKTRWR